MKKLKGNEIINMYLNFFGERGHTIIESASLIPKDDPTVLWINAGVTPLKKYFDGTIVPFTPSIIISLAPLISVTTCGSPIAPASMTTFGKPSRYEARTAKNVLEQETLSQLDTLRDIILFFKC